ncbi:MAG: squalene synthase HpnC [Myxococcales bacterium]|nr:squalene synthase HpnC [Myxococcales bacterium]
MNATEPRLFCVPAPTADERDEDYTPPDGAPPGPWSLASAYRYCERLATTHYENFPVASRFMPAHLRGNVMAIYAFARTADDFADEPRYADRRVEALNRWETLLEACYHRDVEHPVFLALRDTVRRHNIPIGPLKDLLTAFRMDLTKHRYNTFQEIRHYCRHSAHPVGRLVLYVHGHRAPDLHRFSDEICAALQIANFLQDVSVDLPRGRCYLPEEDLVHFGVTREDLLARRHTRNFLDLMAFSVVRARAMFLRGRPLIRQVSPGLSMELDTIWGGGMAILQRIEDMGYKVLDSRPTLEKRDMAGIAVRSLFRFGRRFIRGEV